MLQYAAVWAEGGYLVLHGLFPRFCALEVHEPHGALHPYVQRKCVRMAQREQQYAVRNLWPHSRESQQFFSGRRRRHVPQRFQFVPVGYHFGAVFDIWGPVAGAYGGELFDSQLRYGLRRRERIVFSSSFVLSPARIQSLSTIPVMRFMLLFADMIKLISVSNGS